MGMASISLPLISLVVCLNARSIGTWLEVIDHPDDTRKTHKAATPLVGGLAVTAPFLMACTQWLWEGSDSGIAYALMIAVGGAFLLGFFDDRKSMPVSVRFLAVIALVLVSLGIVPDLMVAHFNFSFLGEAIQLHSFSIVFTVLVVVGMLNAMNMADGMNGLLCGLCLIWSVFLLFYAPPQITPILVLLAICIFVTMIFNLRGQLFLGDSGAYASGMAISLLTIYVYNTTSGTLHADVVVVWFIVPVLDCLRLMVTRMSERRSPGSPDVNHLHHRLQRLLPRWGALFQYWALVAVPGAFAMAMPSLAPAMVLTVSGIYLCLLVLTSEWFVERLRGSAGSEPARAAPRPGSAGGFDQSALIVTHNDRAGDPLGHGAGNRAAAGPAGHHQDLPTPAGGSPARPEPRFPKAFGRRHARLAMPRTHLGQASDGAKDAAPCAPRKPREAVSNGQSLSARLVDASPATPPSSPPERRSKPATAEGSIFLDRSASTSRSWRGREPLK